MGLTADDAVRKLVKFTTMTHHRTHLKDAEMNRVDEALQLLTNGRPATGAKGAKQKNTYLGSLRNLRKKFGDTGVILCAAGLGPSTIANMREEERVFLPSRLSDYWNELELDVFKARADGLNQGTVPVLAALLSDAFRLIVEDALLSSVAGDVYELSMEDVKKVVAMPGQIPGIVRLTDPYNRYQSSFVTIPLSKELADSLVINRERIVD